VDLLIEEITLAALEAIEQAASEAARAAILASLEREANAIREAQRWRVEADLQRQAVTQAKQAGRKNTLLVAVIGILGGLALGVGGTIYIGGR
jgi:ABC-type transporter Mla maintaining outer membrane lipid asymmetry permease subunit MlaE